MSEELIKTEQAVNPAEGTAAVVAENNEPMTGVEPVVPQEATTPETPVAVGDQAAIDAVSAGTEQVQADAIEQTTDAAAAEQPQSDVVIDDAMVDKAVELMKKFHKSGAAFFVRNLNLSEASAVQLLDKMTEKGILGQDNGKHPRRILITLPPRAEAKKPQITVKPAETAPRGPKQNRKDNKKPPMTDVERMEVWANSLKRAGYTDEVFIKTTCDYAHKNPGFNAKCKWGNTLIVMINRLHNQTLNKIRTFSREDVDHIQKELLRFFNDQPLGESVDVWNSRFQTNFEQRDVVKTFFRVKGPISGMAREDICMTTIINAAWPMIDEEQRGLGGTFAERFVYLAVFIESITTSGDEALVNGLFGSSYHDRPTDAWFEMIDRRNGVTREPVRNAEPNWIKDGRCECGGELTKDANGNTICSVLFCIHHFAQTRSTSSDSFRNGGKPRAPRRESVPEIRPDQIPSPKADRQRKGNWKNRDRHEGDDEHQFKKGGFKKHRGPRFHENQDDLSETHQDATIPETVTVAQFGDSSGFFNNAFAGLELPKVEAEAEKLPPPPAEVPVNDGSEGSAS